MHERRAPTTVSRELLTGIAKSVYLVAVRMAGMVGDVKFTVIMSARIEIGTAETT